MTIAEREIDLEVWSQARFLAWADTQPEGSRYEFDGSRPVAIPPATVGHNRIGRNIREAIRPRLPVGTPCDTYGPQDAIERLAARCDSRTLLLLAPGRTGWPSLSRPRSLSLKSSRRGSPIETRIRSTNTSLSYRYFAILLLNRKSGRSGRSGGSLANRPGTGNRQSQQD
jgi:hypothetical protein